MHRSYDRARENMISYEQSVNGGTGWMQCKRRGKKCNQPKVAVSYFTNIMSDHYIDQRKCAQSYTSSKIQLTIFSFVDLHFNTSMFFAMPRYVLIALESQSTKHCDTSLLNLYPTLQNQSSWDECLFCDLTANHTVRGPSVLHICHHLRRDTKDEAVRFSSNVYIGNVRFAFTNRFTMHTQHRHAMTGKYISKQADLVTIQRQRKERVHVNRAGFEPWVHRKFVYFDAHEFMHG